MKQAWSEQDNHYLGQMYAEKLPVCLIAQKMQRSEIAVRQQALKCGFSSGTRLRPWQQEEIELLADQAGNIPMRQLMEKLKALWAKKGWTGRSHLAVVRQINHMGYSRRVEGDHYSLRQIAEALRCSHQIPQRWLKDERMAEILKPQVEPRTTYISRKNLRKFIREYPGEIAKYAPDVLWLLSVVFD